MDTGHGRLGAGLRPWLVDRDVLAFRGLGPNTVSDLTFHLGVVVTLATGLVAAILAQGRARPGSSSTYG
jgi:hypothetical protein